MDMFEGPVPERPERKPGPPASAAERQEGGAAIPTGSEGLRRLMLYAAGVLLIVMGGALFVARTQVPAVDAFGEDPPRWSWRWLAEPVEFDRWLRPGTEAPRFRSVWAARDGRLMLAGGERGVLLRSDDGGASWSARRIAGAANVASVAIGAAGAVLALDANGAVWRSEDAGRSWSPAGAPARVRALAYAPDGRSATAVAAAGILRTADHGRSWETVAGAAGRDPALRLPPEGVKASGSMGPVQKMLPRDGMVGPATRDALSGLPPAPPVPQLTSLAVTGAGALLGAGLEGLWRSDDGGRTWHQPEQPFPPAAGRAVLAQQRETLLALVGGTLLRSGDRGQTWRVVPGLRLRAITLAPAGGAGMAITDRGAVLRSSDAGSTWSAWKATAPTGLVALATLDGQAAVGVDRAGAVLRAPGIDGLWSPVGRYARYPAPWFVGLAGLLTLPPVGAGLLMLRRRRLHLAHKGLLDNGVSDQPISRAEQDRLAFAPAVEALAVFLRHSATTPPLAIAVNAPWGMGKTSFMGMLVHRLRQLGARPVWFNVWHHQHEDVLLAPLLRAITRQAIPSWWRWQGWRFRARLVARRMSKLNNWGVAMGLVGLLAIPAYVACLFLRATPARGDGLHLGMIDRFWRDLHDLWGFLLGGEWLAAAKSVGVADVLAAAFGALRSDLSSGYRLAAIVLLFMCLYLLWTYLLRPFPASPAILASRLNSRFSLSQAEAKADFRQRFREHFGDVAHALAPRTLTIFIDDLDRCEPQKAAELLEAVNYLCESGPCYVVLGMARDLVEAQVASAHKTLAEEQALMERARGKPGHADGDSSPEQDRLLYARKYLRKLVQLDVNLPSAEPKQALDLLLQKGSMRTRHAPHAGQDRWQRVRETAGALFMPATLGAALLLLLAGLAVQGRDTYAALQAESAAASDIREKKLREVQAFVRDARELEHGLRLQAELARGSGLQVAALRADADVLAGHIKAVDGAVPVLLKETAEGRGRGFDKLLATGFTPHVLPVQQLRARHASAAAAGPGGAGAAPGSEAAAAGIVPAPEPDGDGVTAAAVPVAQGDEPTWPYVLAALPVLLLAIAGLSYRDRFVVEPTAEYEQAVATWQKSLLAHTETSSPRELKRFMNVSRYVVARGHTDDPQQPDIPESTIVEFSARWLLGRAQGGPQEFAELLARGDWSDTRRLDERRAQARWFLAVVGDISG